jgi:hypothetical protein
MVTHPDPYPEMILPYMHPNIAQISCWWIAKTLLHQNIELPFLFPCQHDYTSSLNHLACPVNMAPLTYNPHSNNGEHQSNQRSISQVNIPLCPSCIDATQPTLSQHHLGSFHTTIDHTSSSQNMLGHNPGLILSSKTPDEECHPNHPTLIPNIDKNITKQKTIDTRSVYHPFVLGIDHNRDKSSSQNIIGHSPNLTISLKTLDEERNPNQSHLQPNFNKNIFTKNTRHMVS